MALTGLQIFKLLPNTNCKDCGFQTCLAFAMKLAARQAELDLCPHASEEAKEILGAAATPPIRLVKIGTGPREVTVGEETVLFRHDKTFYHATAIALSLTDTMPDDEIAQRISEAEGINFERAGENLTVNLLALLSESGNAERYAETARKISDESGMPLILCSDDPQLLKPAVDACAVRRPMIYAATEKNWESMAELARSFKVPLAVRHHGSLSDLHDLASKIREAGVEDLVLEPGAGTLAMALENQTLIRRAALEQSDKSFGFPTLVRLGGGDEGPLTVSSAATLAICKYASIVILDRYEPWMFLPLLTLRQNIYTDPQKPLQVDPVIYAIGEPGPDSPLAVTTNFSLTYFIVSTEIEGSGTPAWLAIVEAEGLSVLTAWSAGKFGGELVGKRLLEMGVEEKVSHRKVIIPGYIAVIQGEMEDAMPGWEILVGPEEAGDIPAYLKEVWE
ncbi:MAG: acetyl-CoA decarbonylase/synthase complex subunit gamma [Candidatus Eisenbacteria sp.]|nr:acetyl-CoA decarbonylase/synthase complex subunit gamma [Candidatus Eisenbacteria bacterium]